MKRYPYRIVFMGTPQFAAHILNGLLEEGYDVVAAVSQPDKAYGRKQELRPSEVKTLCLEKGIPVYTPARIRNEYQEIIDLKPDLIITAAYGQIVPKEILEAPKFGCINTHGSLLPKYRGGAPIQRAIINGEKQTGMTIMYMNEKMDEGDIIAQEAIDIGIHDTNSVLFEKLAQLGLRMLLKSLPDIFEGKVDPVRQDHDEATYAPNLDKEIEHIFFDGPVLDTYNHIRGLLDNPGCYFMMKDKRYRIEKAFFEYSDDTEPSTFRGLEQDYLRLDCADGFIKVFIIKPEGKNSMDAKAFHNGQGKNLTGEKLG